MLDNSFCSKSKIIVFLITLILLAGCASTTQVTGSWKNPDVASKDYKRVFIAALTGLPDTRKTLEMNWLLNGTAGHRRHEKFRCIQRRIS